MVFQVVYLEHLSKSEPFCDIWRHTDSYAESC